MGLLFIKTSPVKQYAYEKDFSGVFDALHQSFLVSSLSVQCFHVFAISFSINYNHLLVTLFFAISLCLL